MVIRNYKYKLYVSDNTKVLSGLITSSNFAWNHIVSFANRYYKLFGVSIDYIKLQKHMAKLAKHDQFWRNLDSQTMQAISQKYCDSLKQHFIQLKKGKKRGFPRLHKKHILGSILFKQSGYKVYEDEKHPGRGILVINKLKNHGIFKFKITRPWYQIRNITVKRDNDGSLYLVICCLVPDEYIESAVRDRGAIGMDFGMKTFLTTSLCEEINIPDFHKQALEQIRKADRSYSFKRNARVYGTSFKRAKKVKQKAHRAIANKRSDFHWKLAHKLCKAYSFIALEDLNMQGMIQSKRKGWGRKLSSLGYGEFIQKLKVVADKYHTTVYQIGRFDASSQICSQCGYKNTATKDLSVREWVCPQCGAMHHRDVNAAINILNFALKSNINGEGIPHSPSGSKTLQAFACNAAVQTAVGC